MVSANISLKICCLGQRSRNPVPGNPSQSKHLYLAINDSYAEPTWEHVAEGKGEAFTNEACRYVYLFTAQSCLHSLRLVFMQIPVFLSDL